MFTPRLPLPHPCVPRAPPDGTGTGGQAGRTVVALDASGAAILHCRSPRERMSDGEMSGTKHIFESVRPNFTPLLVVLVAELLMLLILSYQTELTGTVESLLSRLCWRNATVRPPMLLVIIVFGWGLVVRVARETGLKIDHVLGRRCMSPARTYHAALTLLCLVLGAHLVHFVASEFPGLTWRPWLTCNIALHAAILFLGLAPLQFFHAESRFSLIKTLHESLIAPCAPVTFWHVIVADYLTSLAKAFADLQSTACITMSILSEHGHGYVPTTSLWERHNASCADTYANAVMLALPFWWRLMQCLKVYSVTKEKKNLWNALKYSTAFPLVAAGSLRRHRPSLRHDRLFILCALVQSVCAAHPSLHTTAPLSSLFAARPALAMFH